MNDFNQAWLPGIVQAPYSVAAAAAAPIKSDAATMDPGNAARGQDDQDHLQVAFQQKLETDYIAMRRNAFQESKTTIPNDCSTKKSMASDVLWHGVATWERALISFCQVAQADNIDAIATGALDVNQSEQFVRHLAIHCLDPASRVLAMAILDRSLIVDKKTDRSVARTKMPLAGSAKESVDAGKEVVTLGRIQSFIRAGGLKVLRQWLVDAVTPLKQTSSSTKPCSKHDAKRPNALPSPTSILLLPLLNFLCDMPFDLEHIQEAKLDALINKLRRQVKKMIEITPKNAAWKHRVSLLTGDEDNVDVVKKALYRIRSTWKTSFAATKVNQTEQVDVDVGGRHEPLSALRAILQDRRAALESNDSENKPKWLTAHQAKAEKVKQKRKRKRMSTADLEKLEREKERSAMLKEDLDKALAYKRQCQAKLRELEKKKLQEKQGGKIHNSHSRSKNRVHWKDGLSSFTGGRNRALLEQVRMIDACSKKKASVQEVIDVND
ncbi:hypothetical protein MPSEU_000890900 [Mayamaea pseudoterrestris]|nr:hypothetical protein MPSEU_000890900 [Mayamaea pseudoterrestris]